MKTYFAVVTPGLESIAQAELLELGANVTALTHGGLTLSGTLDTAYHLNLHARTVERLLLRLEHFKARDFPTLYKRSRRVDWSRFVGRSGGVCLRASAQGSRLGHTTRLKETVLDAIRDQLPGVHNHADGQRFYVRMESDVCTLSVDTSGEPLHRRGYREATGRAPLRETRAAALLRYGGMSEGTPLVDLCTGSGTFVVEAALMQRRVPPGARRSFAFASWPSVNAARWKKVRDAAMAVEPGPLAVWGSDRSPGAVQAARANAKRAGLEVPLAEQDLRDVEPPPVEVPGLVVANPPYGERLGSEAALVDLYEALGHTMARFAGWKGVVLSTRDALLKRCLSAAGATRVEALTFAHGGMKVKATRFEVPKKPG